MPNETFQRARLPSADDLCGADDTAPIEQAEYTVDVRALSGGTALAVDGADTIAQVKEKFGAALLASGQERMKGVSLWRENARLDESRTLRSYGVGAGAVIQALTTERDVEAALREEREAEDPHQQQSSRNALVQHT